MPQAARRFDVGAAAAGATMALTSALLVWAPVPLGSNRPWAWSLLALWSVTAMLSWVVARAAAPGPGLRAIWPVALAIATTLPVWAWAYLQTVPAATIAWLEPNHLWSRALGAGVADALPLVGLDATAGRDALMRLMSYGAVFWLAWSLAQDAERARRMLQVILATITACAVYGLLNHFAGWETIGWIAKTAYLGDVTGTFVNRNNFATYANLGVVICLCLLAEPFLAARRLDDVKRIAAQAIEQVVDRRWPMTLTLAVLVMASLQSHSRGGLLSLALTVAVLGFLLFLVTRPRAVTAVIVLGVGLLGGWGLVAVSGGITLERLGQIDANYDLEVAGRLTYWQVSLKMVEEHPWQGHGYGNFEQAFAQHRDERFADRVDKAHNTYIEHLVELGVPATVLLYLGPVILFGYCLRGAFVRRRDRLFPLVAVGATVLVALHALVDFGLQIPAVAVTYAALFGIGVAQAAPSTQRPPRPGASLRD
jgi:O-antigen ligase